jgi:hypothetical protein
MRCGICGKRINNDNAMEIKVKHLEFIQTAINRMAGNSFLLKGWTVTLTGGLLALTFKQIDRHYLYISLAVLSLFWFLDSYYLSRERRFVALYNRVRIKNEEDIDFSMETHSFGKTCRWVRCAFSRTLLLFYGGLLAVHLLIIHFI